MEKLITFYISVAIIFFIINLYRYLRCTYYQIIYNTNHENNNALKNFNIKESVYKLFKKSHILISGRADIGIITDSFQMNDFNNSFYCARAYFRHKMLHAPFWVLSAIEKINIFSLVRKTNNKVASLILSVIEGFLLYLLGLYLDTTGIGNKILSYLSELMQNLMSCI